MSRITILTERIARDRAELTALEDGTWEFMRQRRGKLFTARDLADAFSLSLQAANNRCKALYRVGHLDRERVPGEGKQYACSSLPHGFVETDPVSVQPNPAQTSEVEAVARELQKAVTTPTRWSAHQREQLAEWADRLEAALPHLTSPEEEGNV